MNMPLKQRINNDITFYRAHITCLIDDYESIEIDIRTCLQRHYLENNRSRHCQKKNIDVI
jgi:hypothetical protein